MAESEEALQLKRRARRRLVGAIALVTFVVIILPLILDKEPGTAGPSLEVQIPRQESSGFATGVMPPAQQMPAAPAAGKKAEIPPVNAVPPPAKTETSPAKTETSPAKSEREPAAKAAKVQALSAEKAEQGRTPTALGDQTWAVTLDAFSNEKNVRQLQSRLSAVGVKSYTEPVTTSKGELTRVRAGPFASKEVAEKARAKLEAMGFKPGTVASR